MRHSGYDLGSLVETARLGRPVESVREHYMKLFVEVSSDEVYSSGEAPDESSLDTMTSPDGIYIRGEVASDQMTSMAAGMEGEQLRHRQLIVRNGGGSGAGSTA